MCFGPSSFRLVTGLLAARGGLTMRDLVEHLYGDRADGGPEYAEGDIRVLVYRLRSANGYFAKVHCRATLPRLGLEIVMRADHYFIEAA